MSTIKAKCTYCGETMEADSALPSSICPHCGKSSLTEEAARFLEHPDFMIRGGKLVKYTGARAEAELPGFVVKIGREAFSGCETLKRVVIPNGVRKIGANAFSGCAALESVTLPDSLETIGEGAFALCSGLASITIPAAKKIGDFAFGCCASLKDVTLPRYMDKIGELAFDSCASLEHITFPEYLTDVGKCAFNRCSQLCLLAEDCPGQHPAGGPDSLRPM